MTATPTDPNRTLRELQTRLAAEANAAFDACPFSALSRDFFSRFARDPQAKPRSGEVEIDAKWTIFIPRGAHALTRSMAGHLADFLARRMNAPLDIEAQSPGTPPRGKGVFLLESGGGGSDSPESFTISTTQDRVTVAGNDVNGTRDGVVKLVDLIGFRGAPFLRPGNELFSPRLATRLGAIPWRGSYRELVFMGYNAALLPGGLLFELSASDAIPALIPRRDPSVLQRNVEAAQAAQAYGVKTYCWLSTVKKFTRDDPVFLENPDLRGSLTWKEDGEYILCTEHPLVQRYYAETVEGLFRRVPGLAGVVVIIGGEGFYHCFMRPFGVPKGHTNCPRCEKLGGETVVANLCNRMADAARRVNPKAEVVAWPYSAFLWTADTTQELLIRKFKPGVALLTEIEKDEVIEKPGGLKKAIWDYSIDLIGPGERARRQIAACRAAGLRIYLKSEPELAFEAPRLPHIPCLDRWYDRAESLSSCGATGAWVFPAFRNCYGSSAAELPKHAWWSPDPGKETILNRLACRAAGYQAGPHLRSAWKHVSEAIPFSPALPAYYTGPYYLGPAHPMRADPAAAMPEVFYGLYLFHAEICSAEGLKKEPTFFTSIGDEGMVSERFYRQMEDRLRNAVEDIEKAFPLVPAEHRLTFDAEASPIRWFYHTARAHANFYESCRLRDRLCAFAGRADLNPAEIEEHSRIYARWREVLLDEQANAREALPVMEADMRLDFYYGGDHSFPRGADMIRAKLDLIAEEIAVFLPDLARRCGIKLPAAS